MNNDIFLALRARIDQHLKFFDTLERIRWQFTAAFGAGASVAAYFATQSGANTKTASVALLLLFGLCVAGLVTQFRIFALIVVIWKRMLTLQSVEIGFLRDSMGREAKLLQDSMLFPRLGVFNNGLLRLLTVGMASCSLFALLFAIAVWLTFDTIWHSNVRSLAFGLGSFVALMLASFFGTKRYALAVESVDASDPTGDPILADNQGLISTSE